MLATKSKAQLQPYIMLTSVLHTYVKHMTQHGNNITHSLTHCCA